MVFVTVLHVLLLILVKFLCLQRLNGLSIYLIGLISVRNFQRSLYSVSEVHAPARVLS